MRFILIEFTTTAPETDVTNYEPIFTFLSCEEADEGGGRDGEPNQRLLRGAAGGQLV